METTNNRWDLEAARVVLDADMLDDLALFELADNGEVEVDMHGLAFEIVRNLIGLVTT